MTPAAEKEQAMAEATIPAKLEIVEFDGDQLLALSDAAGVHVAIAPICKALGIATQKQQKIIEKHPILQKATTHRVVPFASGGQEMVCLRLDFVSGWLFGINLLRVKPDAQAKVLRYQTECYAVLHAHFCPTAGRDVAGRPLSGATDQASEVYKERRAPPGPGFCPRFTAWRGCASRLSRSRQPPPDMSPARPFLVP